MLTDYKIKTERTSPVYDATSTWTAKWIRTAVIKIFRMQLLYDIIFKLSCFESRASFISFSVGYLKLNSVGIRQRELNKGRKSKKGQLELEMNFVLWQQSQASRCAYVACNCPQGVSFVYVIFCQIYLCFEIVIHYLFSKWTHMREIYR